MKARIVFSPPFKGTQLELFKLVTTSESIFTQMSYFKIKISSIHNAYQADAQWRTTMIEEWFPLWRNMIRMPNLEFFLFIRSGRLKTLIEGEHTGQILNGLQCDFSQVLIWSGNAVIKKRSDQ